MSRSGYTDDNDDNWGLIRYRGAVNAAINGKRGQAFLHELLQALDAMPEHKLIDEQLQSAGCFCALGAVGHARGLDMGSVDPWDYERVAPMFGIAESMAREIVFVNDEGDWTITSETPEQRWTRVRAWVVEKIIATEALAEQAHG